MKKPRHRKFKSLSQTRDEQAFEGIYKLAWRSAWGEGEAASQSISCLSARGRTHIYCRPRAMVRFQAGVFPVLTNLIMPTTPGGIQTRVGRNVPLTWIQLHALSFMCVCVCVCVYSSTSSVPKNKQGRELRGLFWSRSESVESESLSVMSDCLRPHGLYSPWNSPGQNTGVGSLSLLQGILPTQGSNPGFLNCRWFLYQLSHKGSRGRYHIM